MPNAVFVTVLALTLYRAVPSPVPSPPPRIHARRTLPAASDLYSLRARRRIASYLRLRLLEMRKAGLDRAVEVIERRLPADTLLAPR